MINKQEEKLYMTLQAPCISEKGTRLEMYRQYIFRVRKEATKLEIKKAVEKLFNVLVDSVRIANMPGKEKRFGKTLGRRQDWKKAYVMLKEGSAIKL